MPTGDNQCDRCGQWSGPGHVCPENNGEAEGVTLDGPVSTPADNDKWDRILDAVELHSDADPREVLLTSSVAMSLARDFGDPNCEDPAVTALAAAGATGNGYNTEVARLIATAVEQKVGDGTSDERLDEAEFAAERIGDAARNTLDAIAAQRDLVEAGSPEAANTPEARANRRARVARRQADRAAVAASVRAMDHLAVGWDDSVAEVHFKSMGPVTGLQAMRVVDVHGVDRFFQADMELSDSIGVLAENPRQWPVNCSLVDGDDVVLDVNAVRAQQAEHGGDMRARSDRFHPDFDHSTGD